MSSDSEIESSGDSDSDWLNEEGSGIPKKSKNKRRKMMTRGCRNSAHASYQKGNTHNSSISKKLRETIRKNDQLPVICGDKEGTLHKEKYNNGETCIFSEGQWFTPGEFEKFGGKEKNKKWKTSVSCYQIQLQTLIQERLLSSPSFKQKRTRDKERRMELLKTRRSSRHGKNGHTSEFQSTSETSSEQNSVSSDAESDDDSMSQFQGDSFSVTCFRGKGVLNVKRFATATCGKCIRTQNAWLTPEEFLNQNMSSGNWRRDIKGHGIPLGQLIMKRVLTLHTLNCECPICTGDPLHLRDQNNDDVCFMCKAEGDLVTCKNCPRAFHHHCHEPNLQDDTIGENWICCFCTATRNRCCILVVKLHTPQTVNDEKEASL
ncbi:nuclear body protein SP140-like isoform X2 [Trichomycterus rosablanca]|uniref:nuclear body protein SP140-like isoform X2 n=1 Tax=Trichomycterus rosablanca TaxID=2290929 RepID=UPI002F35F97C